MDWSAYPNFTREEFRCKHTGEVAMHPVFMQRLQHLRTKYGKPMIVTSGYRSIRHPEEAKKQAPGEHTKGRAADIAVQGADALLLLRLALEFGFTRIGVNQKGTGRFLHLGDSPDFAPGIWSY